VTERDAPGGLRPYAWAVLAIAVVTAAGLAMFDYVSDADLAMLYLLAIMVAALLGRGPALVAATLAVAAFDFCFVPPRFTFAINDVSHLLTFAVMFAAGLTISTLIVRLRRLERLAAGRELRARTEELRSSLLSAVSHDLRTPLAVITGAATSLRDDADRLTPAARAELLSSIVDDAQRLERVLANLLQLTRVETGLAPAREWVPAEEVVGAALTRLEAVLRDRAIETAIPADLVLRIDPVLFEQLLINLIENALKHGAPPIAIRVEPRGGSVALEVADRGPGLPPGGGARLFEKFVRASAAPGAGLGLAVVRAIAQAHGGDVVAEDRPGGGAVFRVTIPAPPAPPAPLAHVAIAPAEAAS
jgi:two-component system sensor histidine kinase KdpD